MCGDLGRRRILQTPSSLIVSRSPIVVVANQLPLRRYQPWFVCEDGKDEINGLTLEKGAGKVDARVAVPPGLAPPLNGGRYAAGLELLELDEDTVAGPEADDDLWHAKQERLDPELHELALKVVHVAVRADLGRRLELDPVDRLPWYVGLRVPD